MNTEIFCNFGKKLKVKRLLKVVFFNIIVVLLVHSTRNCYENLVSQQYTSAPSSGQLCCFGKMREQSQLFRLFLILMSLATLAMTVASGSIPGRASLPLNMQDRILEEETIDRSNIPFDQTLSGGAIDDFEYETNIQRSEVSLGKDRELFYASMDLKWFFSTLFDRFFWFNLVYKSFTGAKHLVFGSNESQIRINSLAILSSIRKMHKASNLRYATNDDCVM